MKARQLVKENNKYNIVWFKSYGRQGKIIIELKNLFLYLQSYNNEKSNYIQLIDKNNKMLICKRSDD